MLWINVNLKLLVLVKLSGACPEYLVACGLKRVNLMKVL